MAVTWSWKEKLGELHFSQKHPSGAFYKYKLTLYCGNCLAAILYEFKDKETHKNMYQFNSFWGDKDHLKNCLGLAKGYDDLYSDETNKLTKVKLNTYYKKDAFIIAELFCKAGYKVELYYEEPKD